MWAWIKMAWDKIDIWAYRVYLLFQYDWLTAGIVFFLGAAAALIARWLL